jgi:pimeloyl-ACP methyl ester carboxylesterase
MQECRLAIKGHELVVYEYNPEKESIPIIFIHGITGNVGFWQAAQIPLMEQAHWFSLSLPAHYPSKAPSNFSLENMSADMIGEVMGEAVKQLTGGRKAILVGHSTGGFAALCIAHHAPELVHQLVLVDGFAVGKWYGAFAPAQFVARFGETAFSLYWKSFTLSPAAFRLAYIMLSSNWTRIGAVPAFQKSAAESFPYTIKLDIHAMWLYFKRMPKLDIRAWLPNIQQQVSVIHGNCDAIIPPKHAQEMQKLLPNAKLYWIEKSGHLPMFENFPAYEAALTSALEGAMLETRARA